MSLGFKFGVSTNSGFVISSNPGISYENGNSSSISYALSYSKSITQSEPQVNSQLDKTGNVAQWQFEFAERGLKTCDIESNILYELGNESDLFRGDVYLHLKYNFGLYWHSIEENIIDKYYTISPTDKIIE